MGNRIDLLVSEHWKMEKNPAPFVMFPPHSISCLNFFFHLKCHFPIISMLVFSFTTSSLTQFKKSILSHFRCRNISACSFNERL
jgi:hypothetical protein